MRIALGQISSESNHFVTARADLEFFRTTGYVHEGDDVLKLEGTDTELGGAIDVLKAEGVEIVPLIAARANSGGPLTRECWETLRSAMLRRLREAGEIDGILISHHGSMCADGVDDTEGDMISAIRAHVGPRVPIALTLDLHGNITRRMVESADLLVAYEHYPHDDVFSTGQRGARLLLRTTRGEVRPATAVAKLPMLLTGFNASTLPSLDGPYARMMSRAKSLETQPGVLSTSVSHVGSYIDIPEIGCSVVVTTADQPSRARALASALAQEYWRTRNEFRVERLGVAEAVRRGNAIAGGPVLLLDTSDTTGGGACGDGIGVVRGLIECGVTEPCLAMIVDPDAARQCHDAGVGASVRLSLGHQLDPRWGHPLDVTGTVQRVSNGRFTYRGGILGGNTSSMGPSAVLRVGSIDILIMTRPTYDWGREQYESVGLRADAANFVAVKNMMNFRFGYADVMKGCFVLDLPGPTPPDMTLLDFKRVPRPLFPLDEIAEPKFDVYLSRERR